MVPSMPTRGPAPWIAFATTALLVYAAAATIAGQLATLDRPDTLATALTLDLVLLVPLALYLLVLRPRRWPVGLVVPAAVVGLLVAKAIVPEAQQGAVDRVEKLLLLPELLLVAWLLRKVARGIRGAGVAGEFDPLERYREALRPVVAHPRLVELVASEVAMLHYAFASWRSRPHVPAGSVAITQHVRSGQAGLVGGLIFLLLVEGFAVHMLLHGWQPWLAWVFTLSTLYGIVFLLADLRATILRPVLVRDDRIQLRAGLRWGVDVPRELVARVDREAPAAGARRASFPLLGEPTHWVHFCQPVVVQGMYGVRRPADAIGLSPDDATGLSQLG